MSDADVSSSVSESLYSLKDRYELARNHLQHEDGLVNQRVMWFLVFQGLLFSALMAGFALLDPAKTFHADQRTFIRIVVILITILGISSSFIGHRLVRAAYWHINAVTVWWSMQTNPSAGQRCDQFPPLRGTGSKPKEPPAAEKSPKITAAAMFIVLAFLWFILLIAFITFVR